LPGADEAESAHELIAGQSDQDAAIAAAQSGGTHKIQKPRAPIAAAVLDRPDPDRPETAGVNLTPGSTVEDCMALDRKGKLQRPVLTPSGYYCPRNSTIERAARRKQGLDELVEID
jgi:hypothetical protein